MRLTYGLVGDCLLKSDASLAQAIWIDLLNPTAEEEADVEAELGFSIPARADMADIEESARLYKQKDAAVMTAVVVSGMTATLPQRAEVTFILTL